MNLRFVDPPDQRRIQKALVVCHDDARPLLDELFVMDEAQAEERLVDGVRERMADEIDGVHGSLPG